MSGRKATKRVPPRTLPAGKAPTKAGQPQAAFDKQRKPAQVASRRIRSVQRAMQQRRQKQRDSR